MNEALHNLSICPACGSRLVAGSNGALCPACMLQAALAEDPVADDANPQNPGGEQPGTRIGRYKLLEQIGEGGFGIAKATQTSLPGRARCGGKSNSTVQSNFLSIHSTNR